MKEMKEKVVPNRGNSEKIIAILINSMRKEGLSLEGFKIKPDFVDQKGYKATFLRVLHRDGGKELILPRWELPEGTVGERIDTNYTIWLNMVMDADQYNCEKRDERIIADDNLLVYELLLRLVFLICTEQTPENTTKLVLILRSFLSEILNANNFLDNFLCKSNEPTHLKICLVEDHSDWLGVLQKYARFLNYINVPKQASQETENYLTEALRFIKRQLLVILASISQISNYKFSFAKLGDGQIDSELEKVENYVVQQREKNLSENNDGNTLFRKYMGRKGENCEDMKVRAEQIIAALRKNSIEETAIHKIEKIYKLRIKTLELKKISGDFGLFVQSCGWMFILFGIVEPKTLSENIRNHLVECTSGLRIKDNFYEIYSNKKNLLIGKNLLRFDNDKILGFAEASIELWEVISCKKIQNILWENLRLNFEDLKKICPEFINPQWLSRYPEIINSKSIQIEEAPSANFPEALQFPSQAQPATTEAVTINQSFGATENGSANNSFSTQLNQSSQNLHILETRQALPSLAENWASMHKQTTLNIQDNHQIPKEKSTSLTSSANNSSSQSRQSPQTKNEGEDAPKSFFVSFIRGLRAGIEGRGVRNSTPTPEFERSLTPTPNWSCGEWSG